MKRIHISRKKTILIAGIAALLTAAAFTSKAVRVHSHRKYASL
ncbi:hypothetical protein [Erysipelothrix anatis]|nr:hypothetical protein [Erysipelothrix anatis]